MLRQKTSTSWPYVTFAGSYVTSTASRCPVPPIDTCSYVGFATRPPVYPETTEITPRTFSKSDSAHQKQPPANVALAWGEA